MFLSCQICNQRFKQNLFPLLNPSARAQSHHDDLASERAVFIHPVDDDPITLIGFRQEYAFSIDGNRRAKETIASLGLNRAELVELRRSDFEKFTLLRQFVRFLDQKENAGDALTAEERDTRAQARRVLNDGTEAGSQFSSMLRSMTLA